MTQTRSCTNRDIDAGGNCRCGCGWNSDADDACSGGWGEYCACFDCLEIDRQSAEVTNGLRASLCDESVPAETVKRVALALFEHRSPGASWDDAPDWRQERYRDMARVAIREIREG